MAAFRTINRRRFLQNTALVGAGLVAASAIPSRGFAQSAATGIIISDGQRPTLPYGVQTGDLQGDRAVIWSRANKPSRMMVELSTTECFSDSWTLRGPAATEAGDYTAKMDLTGLPAGQKVHYRVTMVDLNDHKTVSEPALRVHFGLRRPLGELFASSGPVTPRARAGALTSIGAA